MYFLNLGVKGLMRIVVLIVSSSCSSPRQQTTVLRGDPSQVGGSCRADAGPGSTGSSGGEHADVPEPNGGQPAAVRTADAEKEDAVEWQEKGGMEGP